MARWLKLIIFMSAVAVAAAIYLLYQINTAFHSTVKVTTPQLLTISSGQYANGVVDDLANRSILSRPFFVKLALKLEPEFANIKKGTYELRFGMTVRELFDAMINSDEKTFYVSLVEGLRWKDWLLILNNNQYLTPSNYTDEQWLALLGEDVPGNALEGWLLPDTYQHTLNTKVEEIVRRAHQQMRDFLDLAWQSRDLDLPLNSPYEALILASIIEKETAVASERPRIAGVFTNRLRLNMRLQTDPTVIYGLGDDFDGNITRRDLRGATAYNTYVIKGLPPTPIAMPSRESIEAALHPLETDELYFVAKGDGSHQFSETLEQHNQAVRTYQLKKSK